MKGLLYALLPLFILVVFFAGSASSPKPAAEIKVRTGTSSPAATITFDGENYTPRTVTISNGDAVEWVNKSQKDFWPASNLHPTHSLYPDSGIFKCRSSEEGNIFDACRPISPGKSYSFSFVHEGEWRYHDHLYPNKTGIIIVK
jgi:plastocyanin